MLINLLTGAALAAQPPLLAELKPLGFLAGYCWRGTTQDREEETHCYEAVFGGKHIRDRYRAVRAGEVRQGERLFSVDRVGDGVTVVFTEWKDTGEVSNGMLSSERGYLLFLEKQIDGRAVSFQALATLQPLGPDSYVEVVLAGDNPELNPRTRFRRLPTRGSTKR